MVFIHGLIVLGGVIYGYVRTGREDRGNILKEGLKTGVAIGVLFGLFGLITGNILISLAEGFVEIIQFIIVAFVVSIEFIFGTLIGDYLEEKLKE
jgi:hypothetical protein